MKLQFKHQKFQAEAAKAVCDVFAGQPFLTPTYLIDQGFSQGGPQVEAGLDYSGWNNHPIVAELDDDQILANIRKIQQGQLMRPSERLEGRYNLTIEMETGVGKTYTYIKTMYELNARYGWCKFIVVVPSIAIREGVYKTFQVTEDHFAEEYGKKIRYFIYNSKELTAIDRFASDSAIHVMIINAQAFNARGKDARRIYMKLDEFRSRRPIDIIAKTNPIVIIDEPQSVEGKQTKTRLKEFNALFTLRYSATPKEYYNLIYRLDAIDAYNKKLVKKITVKGISEVGSTATNGYVYLECINRSKENPTATIQFDYRGTSRIRKVMRTVGEGYNLFENSNDMEEYQNGYTVKAIDGRDSSLEFVNGTRLTAGEVIGQVNEEQIRRIQIRETILSHLEKERELFSRGIKVLSLFFIDEVAKYKEYDETGQDVGGPYAKMFEEEYTEAVSSVQRRVGDEAYMTYLDGIEASRTHAGYFSIDKKNHMIDGKINRRQENTSDDTDAYDLIMKDKERLLDRREPVRFIFSHSALREGWDNPNVFQICTLKQSGSEVRKRQEVGRGLRLCVNQDGERMDASALADDVQKINGLTVIASESYKSFAEGLQDEIAQAVANRPRKVSPDLFNGHRVQSAAGENLVIHEALAQDIYDSLVMEHYVKHGALTERYFEDKKNGQIVLDEQVQDYAQDVIALIDTVYDSRSIPIVDGRTGNVELQVDEEKLASQAFKALWSRISQRSFYVVNFDTEELVDKAIKALNAKLKVSKIYIKVETGTMKEIKSKEALIAGTAFSKEAGGAYNASAETNSRVKYDLIGKIVELTGLTRRTVACILTGIEAVVFNQFKNNPEEFILKAAELINEEKATVIIEHITYDKLNQVHTMDLFTEPTLKGRLDENAMVVKHHLYDYLIYDSTNERHFAQELDTSQVVEVYVKLPGGFYINTPVGHYNPDWAIAFKEGSVKHIYFVAETKGSMSSMQLREVEKAKIHCAREHFKAISSDRVTYDVVDGYEALMQKVMK